MIPLGNFFIAGTKPLTFAEKLVASKKQPTSAAGIARLATSKSVTKATPKLKPVIVGTTIVRPSGSKTTSFTQTVTHPDLVSTKTTQIKIGGTGSGSASKTTIKGGIPTSSQKTPAPTVQKAKSKSG